MIISAKLFPILTWFQRRVLNFPYHDRPCSTIGLVKQKILLLSRAMGKCVFGVNLAILRLCDF